MANDKFIKTDNLGLYIAPSDQNQINFLTWRDHMSGTIDAEGGSNMHIIDKAIEGIGNEKVSKSTSIDFTLNAADWVDHDGVFHCYFTHESITPTCPIELITGTTITTEQYESLKSADIIGGNQIVGSIKLIIMGNKPSIDIPVRFIIRRDL